MATVMILSPKLFKVGKCYSMIRNNSVLKFKVAEFDPNNFSYTIHLSHGRQVIQQLEDHEIKSIKEIQEGEVGVLPIFAPDPPSIRKTKKTTSEDIESGAK